MPGATIDILDHLPDEHIPAGVRLFYTGLEAKLAPVFGPLASAMAFLPGNIQPDRSLAAISEGGLVGILAIQDARGSFLTPSYPAMTAHYGAIAGMVRFLLLMALDSTIAPGDLYLDGIAVTPSHQGRGVGTALITAFENRARENGFTTVSLEVIDTNPRAKKLYSRLGYRAVATHAMGPFSRLFGFRTSCRMSKRIGNAEAVRPQN
ncbi:MAG: GNAT family N-acetyltransferase [Desulfobacterales bacterium]|jgi:ribosomal protein S18 acetylase RimI-like enzyme